MFAGFARHRLDTSNFEYAGKCPVPDCGSLVFELADDEDDDPTGIRAALSGSQALDLDHCWEGGSPDEVVLKVYSKGCMYGYASADLHMAGKLG